MEQYTINNFFPIIQLLFLTQMFNFIKPSCNHFICFVLKILRYEASDF